jgi:hypothetical protein
VDDAYASATENSTSVRASAAAAPADELRRAVRTRAVTFVLGAGISFPYGIPTWGELARRVWLRSFPDRALVWSGGDADGAVTKQFFPIVFELASRKLGDEEFAQALSACLYGDLDPGEVDDAASREPPTSLGAIARVLAAEAASSERRVLRVVTFNADRLLERAVHGAWCARGRPRGDALGPTPVRQITRPSQHPSETMRGPIPVYHLHGEVPEDPRETERMRSFDHTLVFTDSQYWSTTTSLLSLPNTIMGAALHDSTCVFVGLSMTDSNVLRWLALRSLEFATDVEQNGRGLRSDSAAARSEMSRRLRRHFWIRPPSDDPSGLLSEFLDARGVVSVPVDDWSGPSFAGLLESCFAD